MLLSSITGKVLASAAVLGTAAGVAGLGTFGAFTSSTSASTSVTSGTVNIALGTAGTANNRLTIAATGVVPGDTIQRAATLTNSGNQNLSQVTMQMTPTTSSLLDTSAAMGLQVKVESCSVAWTEAGSAPAYTYTCSGTTTQLIASQPVASAATAMPGSPALTAGGVDHLRVTLTLPPGADNTLQGLTSVLSTTFTGTQRAATDR